MSLNFLKTLPQYVVPQHGLSRLMGKLAQLEKPVALKNSMISAFVKHYGVNMAEAREPDFRQYASFNAFFTRHLRPDARRIDASLSTIVSPADGAISAIGRIQSGTLLQAKGHTYTLTALLGGDENAARPFAAGHFMTAYLSPRDYHRVHMPFSGRLDRMIYVPGKLFSVNTRTTEQVPQLFARNERVISYFQTDQGPMAVIMIGAMIVASMATTWAGVLTSPKDRNLHTQDYDGSLFLAKGDEIGYFQLGSTVIVLFSSSKMQWLPEMIAQREIRMGQIIGYV